MAGVNEHVHHELSYLSEQRNGRPNVVLPTGFNIDGEKALWGSAGTIGPEMRAAPFVGTGHLGAVLCSWGTRS
jgi:hypothetical protein